MLLTKPVNDPHKTDPRGEVTRERMLEAAINVFAVTGYEGASTRQLAAAAGVNQPAIQYHFSSKEGLFSAVIEHIVLDLREKLAAANQAITTALATGDGLEASLLQMLDAFADMVLDQQSHEVQGLFIARAELENSAMLAPLGVAIADYMMTPCARVIGRITGKTDQDSALRAVAIVGQVANFKNKCLGTTIRECLGLDQFGDELKDKVKAMVRENTIAILACAQKQEKSGGCS